MIKKILKNINFWKYDNTFSSELSKLTSVRNKLNLPLKYWFMEAKDVCRICYGLKYWSKYHLNKDWGIENNTNLNPFFHLIKSSEIVFIFYCILPDWMAQSIPKEFWKNSHFENMTAGFLRRCKNLLRWIAPKMMNFQPWKKLILTNNAL